MDKLTEKLRDLGEIFVLPLEQMVLCSVIGGRRKILFGKRKETQEKLLFFFFYFFFTITYFQKQIVQTCIQNP